MSIVARDASTYFFTNSFYNKEYVKFNFMFKSICCHCSFRAISVVPTKVVKSTRRRVIGAIPVIVKCLYK
jgi:hypothetical protein